MPGDKSISHRVLMHAALAQGTSHIRNFLHAGVTEAMMHCVRDLGVRLEWEPCESSETFARSPFQAHAQIAYAAHHRFGHARLQKIPNVTRALRQCGMHKYAMRDRFITGHGDGSLQ